MQNWPKSAETHETLPKPAKINQNQSKSAKGVQNDDLDIANALLMLPPLEGFGILYIDNIYNLWVRHFIN